MNRNQAPVAPSVVTSDFVADHFRGHVHVLRVRGAAAAVLAHKIARRRSPLSSENGRASPALHVVVCAKPEDAQRMAKSLSALDRTALVMLLPARGHSPYEQIRPDRSLAMARAATLSQLAEMGESEGAFPGPRYLILSAASVLQLVPPKDVVAARALTLVRGRQENLVRILESLGYAGYSRMPVVEDPGTFSVRGNLLDVWPSGEAAPLRLEFEFDELTRITPFDPETQRRDVESKDRSRLFLGPTSESALQSVSSEEFESRMRRICDDAQLPSTQTRSLIESLREGRLFVGEDTFLPARTDLVPIQGILPSSHRVILHRPGDIASELSHLSSELGMAYERTREQAGFPPESYSWSVSGVGAWWSNSLEVLCLHDSPLLEAESHPLHQLTNPPVDAPSLDSYLPREPEHGWAPAKDFPALVARIRAWLEDGCSVVLTSRNAHQLERLTHLLEHRQLKPHIIGAEHMLAPPQPLTLVESTLEGGVVLEHDKLVLLTEEDIFGRRAQTNSKPRNARRAMIDAVDDLKSLHPDDFVVHVEHGVGRYLGLEHQNLGSVELDVLVVQYRGGRLLLPVYRLNQIQKYCGEGQPKLDRLGGQTFAKTKAKIKKRVRDLADQLLRTYAARHQLRRDPVAPPGEEYAEFEAAFPFEETEDQAAAIADVVADLQRETVMERLVCGDVGFGKTEVALRAAFLTAHSSRQVALLCPTTVLADQHLRTFAERLEASGIQVRGLSRFSPRKQVSLTLAGLKDGSVDVVIGTHRLLSKDVFFRQLGLLIVDEEQRFGVAHKERLKELKSQVDVLTLSATPIPRTLSLAVGGLLDMSVITTAPQKRRAIRTMVARYDESLIRDAIRRELDRGGQVFYVHNRVEGLLERAHRLQELIPGLRVTVGHGQMSERLLEQAMHSFVAGECDVLCSTAIIESGLDIPRANTMIVDRADLFGLSQLYQLRGRVGRASERAFCYLLVPGQETLSAEAKSRIETLERYSELGSGFHVATMDMELRGAGELLGAEQSGASAQVGFDLFSEMLAQATAELQGQEYVPDVDPEISLDVDAFLPDDYIEDVGVRLSIYKRYASAEDEESVVRLDAEMEDRFGRLPGPAVTFSRAMRLKAALRKLRALGLQATARRIDLHLRHDTDLPPARLVDWVSRNPTTRSLSPDGRLTRRAKETESFVSGLEHAGRLLVELDELFAT